ncbi:MarR family transcriptional regulator [Sphingomonas oleivorans]|uniref:MarR family transcriptional regulator n=2 Tax=Sphingomonas oleivorans TaxID=1735121 RepID=A0A2T5G0D1_9SPHN|nr:MarR family transcriptional regulator [Sphingomonas oleivorans]
MTRRETIVRKLGDELNALISASRAVTAEAAENFQPPVSGAAFQILQWLHSFGPAQASRIADAVAMDRSVVSRLTKDLRKLGLIEAQPDPADGRSILYGLADTGRAKVAEAIDRKGSLFRTCIEQWRDAELEQLTRLLRRLNGRS